MLRTFKYRLYPNNSQQEDIGNNIDACRFTYNWALEKSTTAYKSECTSLSAYDLLDISQIGIRINLKDLIYSEEERVDVDGI